MKILLRKTLSEQEETDAAAQYFPVIESRMDVEAGDLIVPRYSSLPYYDELERDVLKRGATLINTYKQHKWIANFEWYDCLRRYTFDSWDMSTIAKAPPDIAYVVKGKTNSKKWQWNRHMYAKNREEAVRMGCDLYTDGLIGSQGIIFRRFEKLNTFEIGVNGLPFSNEFRFFFLRDKLVDSGYYWSIAEDLPSKVPADCTSLAKKVAGIAAEHANFFVLDIAQREGGDWVLVEINCGTMSGLSCIEPDSFYRKLSQPLLL